MANITALSKKSEQRSTWQHALVTVRQWFDSDYFPEGAQAVRERPDQFEFRRCLPFLFLHAGCLGVVWVGWSCPVPVQRPIPIWFGGSSDAVIKRCARIGDGWMPILAPDAQGQAKLGQLREHLKAFGRDPATFGLEAWIRTDQPDYERWAAAAQGWKRLGAQMVMLHTMYRLTTFEQQIETLRRFKEVADS